ncbi:DUF6125 family protein [Thermodesulfobacteriota bacterium]
MDLKIFERMEAAELRKYIEFLLWHYRVVDGFWFIYTTEQFDQSTAEHLNERVWEKATGMAAKEILSRFQIKEKGLKGFLKAIKYYPWDPITGFEIQENSDELILSVPSCPPNVARRKRGLGDFDCKKMEQDSFESFARVVDENIRVECIFAPPDPHPPEVFCKWRFYLEEN